MGFAPVEIERYKGLNPQILPREWSNYYVVYQYEDKSINYTSDEYIVGFESIEAADEFADALKDMASKIGDKRDGFRTEAKSVEIYDHYPRRLLEKKK